MFKPAHILFIGILIFFVSCASTPNTHYYLIESAPVTKTAQSTPRDISLAIDRVTAEMPYSDDRLIYRDSVYEIKFYHYHRWVKPPEMMVTDKIVEQLKTSHICKNVFKSPSPFPPDFILKGQIIALEEWDEGQQWFGRVRLSFSLMNVNSREVVWQQEFFHQTPIAEKKPVAVVQALSTSIDKCLADLVSSLKPHLR